MIPVYQEIFDKGRGDCVRAAVASVFELELIQVPHFILYGYEWWAVYYYYMISQGYKYKRTLHYRPEYDIHDLSEQPDIEGCYLASVKSLNIPDVYHAIIIDKDYNVIHDPSTRKSYTGMNIRGDERLSHVEVFKKMCEDVKACYSYLN